MQSSSPLASFSPFLNLKSYLPSSLYSELLQITHPKALFKKLRSLLSSELLKQKANTAVLKFALSLQKSLLHLFHNFSLVFSGAEVADIIEDRSSSLKRLAVLQTTQILQILIDLKIMAEIANKNDKVLSLFLLLLEATNEELEAQQSTALLLLFYNLKIASEIIKPASLNFTFLRSFSYLLTNLPVLFSNQETPVIGNLGKIDEFLATKPESREMIDKIKSFGKEKEKSPMRLQSLDPYIAPQFITWMPREERLKNTLSVKEQERKIKRTIKAQERAVMRELKKDTQALARQRLKEAEEEKDKEKVERARVRKIMEDEALMIKKWKTEQTPARGPKKEKKKRMAGNETEQKK